MIKTQVSNQDTQKSEPKNKHPKSKGKKDKDENLLVGRVKKAIKKSRRKLSEEKFEKELKRTIAFLEELQVKIGESNGSDSAAPASDLKKAPANKKSNKKAKPGNSGKKSTGVAKKVAHAAKTEVAAKKQTLTK